MPHDVGRVAVILGTERITDCGLQISACVIDPDGAIAGWQDKTQIDPSEEDTYPALGTERRLFSVGSLTFGVVICHEGFRYPETVRWAVRRGAQVVFHTSAIVRPDGTLQRYQPYGQEGLLVADLDLRTATGLLASRCRISPI
jgi:predicted amidohydrolase